jgi:phosphoribosylaminoimidazolecarboxamide formyltransferase / IMP cyclohydrolase
MNKQSHPIHTALISVTNKTGLVDFAAHLFQLNPSLKIIASGGTAKTLREAGINTTPIEQYTGFPECFEGRVKTLHPNIAGGILHKRGDHDAEAKELGIYPIDMVICNLYRFQDAANQPNITTDELIEQMDIGGSTLIRSAIKNHQHVAVVTDINDYTNLMHELDTNKGALSLPTRRRLAHKAAVLSAEYEAAIAKELSKRLADEETYRPNLSRGRKLRYGENPDQEAWVYQFSDQYGIAQSEVLAGKDPSYNNYEDATCAHSATDELARAGFKNGVAVIKHGSLCGYATGPTLEEAFDKAWEGDSKSAFGSVISFTEKVEESIIPHLKGKFIEVIIAPEFDASFVEWTKEKKPNLRLLKTPTTHNERPLVHKNVSGGMLVQTRKELQSMHLDSLLTPAKDEQGKRVGIVTKKQPNKDKHNKYVFSIAAVNYAKSNAIVIVREWTPGYYQLIGCGSGQPNRVDSLQRLAIPKAIENLTNENVSDTKEALKDCVLASDGFFPFDDSVRYAAEYGIRYCIQPGGSIRDDEVIQAADELDVCMVFTGERYFTH